MFLGGQVSRKCCLSSENQKTCGHFCPFTGFKTMVSVRMVVNVCRPKTGSSRKDTRSPLYHCEPFHYFFFWQNVLQLLSWRKTLWNMCIHSTPPLSMQGACEDAVISFRLKDGVSWVHLFKMVPWRVTCFGWYLIIPNTINMHRNCKENSSFWKDVTKNILYIYI